MASLRTLYPTIEPNRSGFLDVGDGHLLYWEESGSPKGKPVIFLHGGPGSGTRPDHRRFFHPNAYRIILMDQRGAGQSRPHASLVENTTWHLVDDLEKLRKFLKIEAWFVFGGSWGSTLAITYAESHPEKVLALIVRGIFLARSKEIRWFYQHGAHHLFTDEWERFLAPIPVEERRNMVEAYYKRLTSSDPNMRKEAALAWTRWEAATLKLVFDPALFQSFTESSHADALARIECHYFVNRSFFQTDNWLIQHAGKLAKIPGVIIQGRYDIVCPFESAWELHLAWPKADFIVIPDAGHAGSEPGIADALIRATDRFQ
ncbi:MAG: prolyl aminopeptidase [Chlamydiae bacterium]|nr:prolyl aminopeptidase [Chlamydiota bacterium]